MKVKALAERYNFDLQIFTEYIKSSGYRYKETMWGLVIEEGQDLALIVSDYRKHCRKREAELNAMEERRLIEEEKKRQALASMLITSGFSFDGYTIKKYSGYISGDDAIQIDRGRSGIFANPTNVGDSLMKSLSVIRRNALQELKEAAYALGCNAVIGVDFDYLTLDPETVNATGGTLYLPYVFGVTANGNAVIIEKDEE